MELDKSSIKATSQDVVRNIKWGTNCNTAHLIKPDLYLPVVVCTRKIAELQAHTTHCAVSDLVGLLFPVRDNHTQLH